MVAPDRGNEGAQDMADLTFVVLTVAFFALTALIVRGVERL